MFLLQLPEEIDPILLGAAVAGLVILIIVAYFIIMSTRKNREFSYKPKVADPYEVPKPEPEIKQEQKNAQPSGIKIMPNTEELPKIETPVAKPVQQLNIGWKSDIEEPPLMNEISWDPDSGKSSLDPPNYLTGREAKQADKLVLLLEPTKGKYTAGQIKQIMLEEKYSERVANE